MLIADEWLITDEQNPSMGENSAVSFVLNNWLVWFGPQPKPTVSAGFGQRWNLTASQQVPIRIEHI